MINRFKNNKFFCIGNLHNCFYRRFIAKFYSC